MCFGNQGKKRNQNGGGKRSKTSDGDMCIQ